MENFRIFFCSNLLLSVLAQDSGQILKISNGHRAHIRNHPYQVLIKTSKGYCGGALIRGDIVLSTMHCAQNNSDTTIFAGSSRFEHGEKASVDKIIPHQRFNVAGRLNDIAIFFLSRNLTTSSEFFLKKIRIAEMFEALLPDTQATISGWGSTEPDGEMSQHLRAVNVTIMDSKMCKKLESRLDISKQLCSVNPESKRDATSGDFGGPLVYDDALIGLISEAYEWRDIWPRVYTKVAGHRDWITQKILEYFKGRVNIWSWSLNREISKEPELFNDLNYF